MNINLFLNPARAFVVFLTVLFIFFNGLARSYAEESQPAAMPVPAVVKEDMPVWGDHPVVIELFSSQACAFCPAADQFFANLLKQDHIIGLSCHVDYFDVKKGALSHDFCTQRQSRYMKKYFSGPPYTPQIIINGMVDAVGYQSDKITKILQGGGLSDVALLSVFSDQKPGIYIVSIPPDIQNSSEDFELWLALYDRPHERTISSGLNKGQQTTYYNMISSLELIDITLEPVKIMPGLKEEHAGFILMLQNIKTGHIVAAGQYQKGM